MTPTRSPRSDLARLWQQYAPIVAAVITVLGFGIKAIRMYDAHMTYVEGLREHIRVLERITVSEHPEYTAAINWKD